MPPRHHGIAELGGRLSRQRIDLVVGTRPEAIKLAPVATALAERGRPARIILTGQHPIDPEEHGLVAAEFVRLNCRGEHDPHLYAGRVARAVAALLAVPPGLLVVQGDTASALGAALAGFAAAIPVAHVEAGLRSFDPAMPWPEEEYRTAIDARAALLFAPTEVSAANLRAERVPGRIFVTGNTGVDALLQVLERLPQPQPGPAGRLRLLVTCHRRENWGSGLAAVAAALAELARDHPVSIDVVMHPNPAVSAQLRGLLDGRPHIRLAEPLAHDAMIAAMRASDLLLSDSGGVQEEAPTLGLPLLVLRDKTERPEGVASGNMRLVGTDRRRIVEAVATLLDPAARAAMSRHAFPFGDGRSAPRIAGHICEFMDRGAAVGAEARRA